MACKEGVRFIAYEFVDFVYTFVHESLIYRPVAITSLFACLLHFELTASYIELENIGGCSFGVVFVLSYRRRFRSLLYSRDVFGALINSILF